jgi:hypothetical protein
MVRVGAHLWALAAFKCGISSSPNIPIVNIRSQKSHTGLEQGIDDTQCHNAAEEMSKRTRTERCWWATKCGSITTRVDLSLNGVRTNQTLPNQTKLDLIEPNYSRTTSGPTHTRLHSTKPSQSPLAPKGVAFAIPACMPLWDKFPAKKKGAVGKARGVTLGSIAPGTFRPARPSSPKRGALATRGSGVVLSLLLISTYGGGDFATPIHIILTL